MLNGASGTEVFCLRPPIAPGNKPDFVNVPLDGQYHYYTWINNAGTIYVRKLQVLFYPLEDTDAYSSTGAVCRTTNQPSRYLTYWADATEEVTQDFGTDYMKVSQGESMSLVIQAEGCPIRTGLFIWYTKTQP
jgi:hypothetical protein